MKKEHKKLVTRSSPGNSSCASYCFVVTDEGRRIARNSQWGAVLGVVGVEPLPPEANGGLGAEPPATGRWGSGAEPQRSKILHFFCQNNLILELF